MVSPTNIKIMSYNNSQYNNTTSKTNLNTNINTNINKIYELYYPQNDEERWIISQIKKLYSKLLIAHFNILKINANLRKELYEELLIKYKNFFEKDFIPEDNIEDYTGNENNNYNFDNNSDKENKRITIKNSIQSYVEDSSDEEACCYHCDGPIELKDTEMCECFGHPYCCDECSVDPPDENDSDRYCSLCVPLQEIEINSDTDKENNTEHETEHNTENTENIESLITSDNSKKEDTEKELRKILGIELRTDSIPNESPLPYNQQNSNSYLNNSFIAKEA
jgi:hypothetical protein